MLVNRSTLREHLPWIVACLAVTGLATAWYAAAALGARAWPGGSSPAGFTFGIVGGLICLFEFALWGRKKVRAWRLGRTKVWMRAHIWLGLLAVPLLIYHSGFRFGGSLSMALMILFLVVIASGVWGLVVQQFLPRVMFDEVPAETIYSQIDTVSGHLTRDAERLVLATCGPESKEGEEQPELPADYADVTVTHLVVGAVRSAGRVQGKVLETRAPAAPIANTELLRSFFNDTAKPYLLHGAETGSSLAQPARADAIFEELRTRLPPEAHNTVHALEGLCEQRRQLDLQRRLHFWLHNWLLIHLPLSVALVVLMFVHVFVAVKYW